MTTSDHQQLAETSTFDELFDLNILRVHSHLPSQCERHTVAFHRKNYSIRFFKGKCNGFLKGNGFSSRRCLLDKLGVEKVSDVMTTASTSSSTSSTVSTARSPKLLADSRSRATSWSHPAMTSTPNSGRSRHSLQ